MKPQVTIVIPVRNEALTIIPTLKALSCVKVAHRVLVISDVVDVCDRTEEIVAAYVKTKKETRLIRASKMTQHGFSAALCRGVRNVTTPYCVFMMADSCDDPRAIDVMYKKIRQGYDVVCASRYSLGGKRLGGPRIQSIGSRVVNWTWQHWFGIQTKDATNAYKMYKTALLRTLFFDPSMGSEVSLSLLVQAQRRGAVITDIPTIWRGRLAGEAKFHIGKQCIGYLSCYRL